MQTISHTTSFLAEPTGEERISDFTLGYVTEMAREEVFDMLATACVEAGVPRNQIAKRLGKEPAQISRMLNSPGNFTIDTIAQTLFAINGNMFRMAPYSPLMEPKSNAREPYNDTMAHSSGENFVYWGEAIAKVVEYGPAPQERRLQSSKHRDASRALRRAGKLVRIRAEA